MEKRLFYLDLRKVPEEDDFVAQFFVEPSENVTMEEACNSIAAESSIGTWTEVSTMTENFREKFKARVTKIDGNIVEIAYPSLLLKGQHSSSLFIGCGKHLWDERC